MYFYIIKASTCTHYYIILVGIHAVCLLYVEKYSTMLQTKTNGSTNNRYYNYRCTFCKLISYSHPYCLYFMIIYNMHCIPISLSHIFNAPIHNINSSHTYYIPERKPIECTAIPK